MSTLAEAIDCLLPEIRQSSKIFDADIEALAQKLIKGSLCFSKSMGKVEIDNLKQAKANFKSRVKSLTDFAVGEIERLMEIELELLIKKDVVLEERDLVIREAIEKQVNYVYS